MGKRIFHVSTFTPTALADTTNLTNTAYMGLGANSALIGLNVIEIYIGGQAVASAVDAMVFARDVVIGGGLTTLAAPNSDGPMSGGGAAAIALSYVGGSTLPQRSSAITSAKLGLSLNAFGGIVRWVAAPGEEWTIFGVTVNISESTLSAQTAAGGGLIGANIVYEPL